MEDNYKEILNKLESKASLKQAIYRSTAEVFSLSKVILSKIASKLHQDYTAKDPSVEVIYKENNQFEAQLKFSGDMLMLSMHSNVFNFDEGHSIFQTSYVKTDVSLSYCGAIYIHNFLADSIKYNRLADEGSLIARILVNKENHFMVEGDGTLGFLYENFEENIITEEKITDILEKSILFCLSNDLILPPYAQIKDVTLHQKQSLISAASGHPTGKRLGYLFSSEIQQNNNI
ncbi:hypothetical protein FA048_16380 [Pedobacter polaris]|uniref:Uncharacterized protein n=1 Tax=Pedobacter polaris TaxID=2571273 RepID=A0A4U1CIS9_9SPHI|nr:hypothetical protein [Pedobacter polaris]TKC06777.1 hypothetical protein FA048_16380 [Pedobacter polaris]